MLAWACTLTLLMKVCLVKKLHHYCHALVLNKRDYQGINHLFLFIFLVSVSVLCTAAISLRLVPVFFIWDPNNAWATTTESLHASSSKVSTSLHPHALPAWWNQLHLLQASGTLNPPLVLGPLPVPISPSLPLTTTRQCSMEGTNLDMVKSVTATSWILSQWYV